MDTPSVTQQSEMEPSEAIERAYAELNQTCGPLSDDAYTQFGYIASAWWPKLRAHLLRTPAGEGAEERERLAHWLDCERFAFADVWSLSPEGRREVRVKLQRIAALLRGALPEGREPNGGAT